MANVGTCSMAYAEMFMLVASLTRRVRMRLHDTSIDCVSPGKDHLVVMPKDPSGVKVVIEGINTC